jgi:hypothetical protein
MPCRRPGLAGAVASWSPPCTACRSSSCDLVGTLSAQQVSNQPSALQAWTPFTFCNACSNLVLMHAFRRSRDRGTRAGARAQGATVDGKLIFNDPEAHMRRIREEQRRAERLLHDQTVRSS